MSHALYPTVLSVLLMTDRKLHPGQKQEIAEYVRDYLNKPGPKRTLSLMQFYDPDVIKVKVAH